MLKTALTIFFLAGNLTSAEIVAAEPGILAEIKTAERSIDNHFRDISTPDPMGLTGITRGAYVNGFGAIFSFEVMLVPVVNISPFRPAYTDEEKQKLNVRKRQRLEDLEVKARQILIEEASKLKVVPVTEKVVLVVSLFHFNWENLSNLPTQLVMQATRQTALDMQAKRIDPQEFRKNLDVQYF
jgi:hypothetical protein